MRSLAAGGCLALAGGVCSRRRKLYNKPRGAAQLVSCGACALLVHRCNAAEKYANIVGALERVSLCFAALVQRWVICVPAHDERRGARSGSGPVGQRARLWRGWLRPGNGARQHDRAARLTLTATTCAAARLPRPGTESRRRGNGVSQTEAARFVACPRAGSARGAGCA